MGPPSAEYFQGKCIFITGATGFLGFALVVKLLCETSCRRLLLLVRGEEDRLWDLYRNTLPTAQYHLIRQSKRVKCILGDLRQPRLALSDDLITELQSSTQIIIHAASTISLQQPLPEVAPSIVELSLTLADIALGCPNLERFVYISTAYANAHLHTLHSSIDTLVLEQVYPLRSGGGDSTALELQDLRACGTTPEYRCHNFPFPYAYAKHLTERALMSIFARHGKSDRLLVVRPSILGPALREPYPYYEIRGSAPATNFLAAVVASPSLRVVFSSRFRDPARQSNLDEIPVDVAVNRILMHICKDSSGIVHAVAGQRARRSFEDLWARAMSERRLPWWPGVGWLDVDWHADNGLHAVAKAFKIIGTSFLFEDARVQDVWSDMSDDDRAAFPLFLESPIQSGDMTMRRREVRRQIERYFCKKGIPRILIALLIRSPISSKKSD